MKENPVASSSADSAKAIQKGRASDVIKTRRKTSPDSVNFSPQRLQDQASTKSTVLIKMLEREEKTYYSRHWGINE